ncbi:MAG: class I adenylate-forming enzyme family protein [Casimicrobiaceae bacterium]
MERSASHNLAALLVHSARRWPSLPAVALGARVVCDYAALATHSARLAATFKNAGLAVGDRVALIARNVPGYVETLFACWWAGLVAVPVNAKLHPRELAFIILDSGARWAFVDEDWHAALGSVVAPTLERATTFGGDDYNALFDAEPMSSPAPVAASDAAWLFYTSGTTGRPKGVVLAHGNLRAMTRCFVSDVESIEPADTILHPAPLSHGSGLYVVPHVACGAVNVIPESGGFDADEIVALLAAWDRCLLFAAPTMVKRFAVAPSLEHVRLDRLKCIVYGGGPMYVEDCKAAYAALGPRLAQIYGQGETPMTITAMSRALLTDALVRGDDARIASVGIAQTGIDVRIADTADRPLAYGDIGEVLVRGPTVMQGYWRNAQATQTALANGWLHTGDLGSLDDDGFLTLKDRSKDLIISGGSNIYPREVEEVLLKHPRVAEVAVLGRWHAEWGEEVVACVVPRVPIVDPAAWQAFERELDRICLDHIARFKRPKAYVFFSELPKNHAGKVVKTELRKRVLAA